MCTLPARPLPGMRRSRSPLSLLPARRFDYPTILSAPDTGYPLRVVAHEPRIRWIVLLMLRLSPGWPDASLEVTRERQPIAAVETNILAKKGGGAVSLSPSIKCQ